MKVAKIQYWDSSIIYIDNPTHQNLRSNIEAAKKHFGPEKMKKFERDKRECKVTILEMSEEEFNKIPVSNFSATIYEASNNDIRTI